MYLYVNVILDVKPVKGFGHVNMSIALSTIDVTKIRPPAKTQTNIGNT
jgi:hypothetical protein